MSNKCNAHRLALRRHGHPEQVGLKAAELAPYRTALKRLWDQNERSPMWEVVRARWQRLVARSQALVTGTSTGVPYNRHELRAAEELLKLHNSVPLQDIAVTAMAAHVLQADRPHRFKDDQAFAFQLVRRVRALDYLAIARCWNQKRRRIHMVYRDLSPGSVRILAGHLAEAFGEAGMLLRDHERSRPRLAQTESKLMADAMRSLR